MRKGKIPTSPEVPLVEVDLDLSLGRSSGKLTFSEVKDIARKVKDLLEDCDNQGALIGNVPLVVININFNVPAPILVFLGLWLSRLADKGLTVAVLDPERGAYMVVMDGGNGLPLFSYLAVGGGLKDHDSATPVS